MEDIEANESAAGESPCLSEGEESTVEEMAELQNIVAESSDISDTKGNTDLHNAVLSFFQQADTHADFYRRIDELMTSQDTQLNRPNKEGYTAIGLAVHHHQKMCIERMLSHPSAHRLYLDYYPADSDQTVREIIMQTYPDLVPLLPAPLMERLDSPDRDMKLLAALQHDEFDIFRDNLDETHPNPRYDEPYYCSLLEIACQMKKREQFVKFLVQYGADVNTAFSNAVERKFINGIILLLDNDINYDVVNTLESASMSFLNEILDNCFEYNNEICTSKDLKVTFKFMTLFNMVGLTQESHHKDLLRHPVMSIFVNLAWKKLKYFFFLDVAFYIMFVLSLTTYILFSEYFNTPDNTDLTNNTRGLLRFNESVITSSMSYETWYNTSQSLWYILMVLLGLLFAREVFQLVVYHVDYILTWENWLELLLIVVTFTSCSGLVEIFELKRHFFAIAILLGWFELVLLLGRLPLLSVQTEMFKAVSLTFLKFMAGYVILILAFSFSFYVLFKENTEVGDAVLFSNPLISILGGMVMFAGEFNAANLHFSTLPGTSHVIFLLFVFFVTIVLFNLLQGLAVGDTRKVWEKAETLSLDSRVKLITYIVYVYFKLPNFMTRSFEEVELMFCLYPNRPNEMKSTELKSLKNIITEKREKSKKDNHIKHPDNSRLFAEITALKKQSEEMRQILMSIQTHLNI
jgi:hypothetical protein